MKLSNIGKLGFVTLALVLNLVLITTPSKAVFGLSKCERVVKELNREQEIGYRNWKKFDEIRDFLLANKPVTLDKFSVAVNAVKLVYYSDSQIYESIDKNNKCFDTDAGAKNRENLDEVKRQLNSIKTFNNDYRKKSTFEQSQRVTDSGLKWLQLTYQRFADWKTGKILKN